MQLVKDAASIIQQHNEQQEHYRCKVMKKEKGLFCIHLVRSSDSSPFCAACSRLPDDQVCDECHVNSPIARIRFCRTITIIPHKILSMYVFTCSCYFHGTYGIPCHDVATLLRIRSRHVHIRHHKK